MAHPSASDTMDINQQKLSVSSVELDTSIFTDPHFLAAARTFQDHIFSNWTSAAHAEGLKRFQEGVCTGKLSVAWKDEVWESQNRSTPPEQGQLRTNGSSESAGRTGLVG